MVTVVGQPVVAPATAAEATPLEVTIESLTPSTIPSRGDITVTGEIVNRSDETWRDLNVYLLTSSAPMTTEEEVDEASESDPALEVGDRITTPGLYEEVGDLAPGQSTSYRLSIPRSALAVSGAGVYWLGVHVLGADDAGRIEGADGRARTFIPLMDSAGPRTRLSLLVPVNGQVRRRADGGLGNLERWQRVLGSDGRLGRLLDLALTDASVPLTWVVDPAVLDAAGSVAADNPPLDTTPTDTEEAPTPTGSPSASPSPSAGSTEEPGGFPAEEGEEPVEPSPQAVQAADWLASFLEQSEKHPVMSTPYGNTDVSAALRRGFPDLYRRSLDLSAETMADLGVEAEPVIAPAEGYLPTQALGSIDPDLPLLLARRAAPEAGATVVRSPAGHEVVLTDHEAAEGGPQPGPRFGALAMRQRILAQAAVHSLAGSAEPLVLTLPPRWDPGAEWRFASFFSGLDVPWMRTIRLDDARRGETAPPPTYDEPLVYPGEARRRELPRANLRVARSLVATGRVFASLLTRNDTVDRDLAKAALLSSSANVRSRPARAVRVTRRADRRVHAQMERIRIDGPPFVTMSSNEGSFQVTVVNNLDEAVTVGIEADTGTDDMTITSPDPVDLGPGQRAVVRLSVASTTRGLRSVTLSPTTSQGDPLGGSTTFTVRSTQVGLVIWIIMGVGGAVLLVAIVRRVVRRVRARVAAGSAAGEGAR